MSGLHNSLNVQYRTGDPKNNTQNQRAAFFPLLDILGYVMFVAGTVVATTTLLAMVGAWSLQLPQFYQAPFRGFYHEETPRFFLENHFRHPFQFYQAPGISVPQPLATTPLPPSPPPPPNPSLQPRSAPAQVTNVHHHVFYYYYLPASVESTPRPKATTTRTATGTGVANRQLCIGDDGPDVAVVSPPMYLPPPPAPPTELPSLPDLPPSTQAPCQDDTVVVDNVNNLLDYPFGRSAKTNKQIIQSQSQSYQNPEQQQQVHEHQQIPQQQTIQQSQWIPQQQPQQIQERQHIPQQQTIQQSQWIPQQQDIQQRQQNHQQIQQQQQQFLQQQLHRKLVSSRDEVNVAEKKNGFVLANFLLPPDH